MVTSHWPRKYACLPVSKSVVSVYRTVIAPSKLVPGGIRGRACSLAHLIACSHDGSGLDRVAPFWCSAEKVSARNKKSARLGALPLWKFLRIVQSSRTVSLNVYVWQAGKSFCCGILWNIVFSQPGIEFRRHVPLNRLGDRLSDSHSCGR